LYPLSFSIDPNGKRYKSHYTILLPFVDEKRLHKILEDKFSLLTPEERKQNEIENDLLFIYSRTEAYTSLRQLFEINNGNNKITYDNPLDISTVIGILGCIWRDGNDNRIKLIDKSIKAPIPNYRNISDNQVMCVKYR
jgi:5'-3' exonuclease